MTGFKPPPKRKKVDGAASVSSTPCNPVAPPSDKVDVVMMLINKPKVHEAQSSSAGLRIQQTSPVHEAQSSSANLRIQQARNHAVTQAQQDGYTGNFKVFDSPYGNYLVPVIPSRADLGI